MTERKKHKKIFYIPGILTLVIVPIFFFVQIKNHLYTTREYVIPIIKFFDTDSLCDVGWGLPRTPAERKYLLFNLIESKKDDSLKLVLIKNILIGIEKSRDTTIGVKIIFNNALKYGTVVEAINTCLKSDINTFLIHSDTLISYHRAYTYYDDTLSKIPWMDKAKAPPMLCGGVFYDKPEPQRTFYYKIIENRRIIIISTLYIIWFIIIGYWNIRKLVKINEW